MKDVKLTDEEITVTIQLIDIAIKASGLNAAEAGSILAKKLSSYLSEPQPELEEPSILTDPADLQVASVED